MMASGHSQMPGFGAVQKLRGFAPLRMERISIDVGAERPFKAMHVSDSHVVRADATDDDPMKIELAATRLPLMGYGEHYLAEAVVEARRENAILLHTGDVTDFVSNANLRFTELTFGADDWFVCAGNHDYSRYVGEAREDSAYKAGSMGRVQSVFPNDLTFASRVVNGVNFVAVDDVYYNFSERQLALMESEVAKGLPIVLMCHVPIYLPGHYAEQMRRTDGVCSYETGVPGELINTWRKERDWPSGEEWRDRRVQQRPDAATTEFVAYLKSLRLLRAILCGHCHAFWAERFSATAMQLTCAAMYEGGCTMIDFH